MKIESRDGNEAPILDPRRGFPPLEDAIGVFLVPAGSLMGKFPSPSGEPGDRTFQLPPSPFHIGDPDFMSIWILGIAKSSPTNNIGPNP